MISSLSIRNHYTTELERRINEIIILIPINKVCKINLNGAVITINNGCIINNADLYQYIDVENLVELKIPLPLFVEKDKTIANAFFDFKQIKYAEQFRNLVLQKLHDNIQDKAVMNIYISNIIDFLLKEARVNLKHPYLPYLYTKHPLVQRLTQYVHKHIDASLSTKQVSNVFYISQSYISILFSKILNMNFKQYTSSLKIALSLHDLLKEEQSIYDVAMKYSFTNVSTYSKNFKTYVNVPPKHYIYQFRKNRFNEPYQVSLKTPNLSQTITELHHLSHQQYISSNRIILDKLKYNEKFNMMHTFIKIEDWHMLLSFNQYDLQYKIKALIPNPNLIIIHTGFDHLNKLEYQKVFNVLKRLTNQGYDITLKVDNSSLSQTIDYQIIKILDSLSTVNDSLSHVSLLFVTNQHTLLQTQSLIQKFKHQFPSIECGVNIDRLIENGGILSKLSQRMSALKADFYFIDMDWLTLGNIISTKWVNSKNDFDIHQVVTLFLRRIHPTLANKIILGCITHKTLKHYYNDMSPSSHILLLHSLIEFQSSIKGFAFPYFSEDDDQFMFVNRTHSTMPLVHILSLLKPFLNLNIVKFKNGIIGKSKYHTHVLLYNQLFSSTEKSYLVANIMHNFISDFPVYTRILNQNHGIISHLIPNNLDLSYIDPKILEQINKSNHPLSKLSMHCHHDPLTIRMNTSEIQYIMFPNV